MVLEELFNPFSLKKKPWHMFMAGFFYSLISLLVSYMVFKEAAGLLTVFLIVIAVLPTVIVTFKREEELDLELEKESTILKEHTQVIVFLMCMFLGVTIALLLAYVFLPQNVVGEVFSIQHTAINNVNNNVHASIIGYATKFDLFSRILLNNVKVLFFCILFSFLYGTGAIFILTWNASVVSVAMGNLIKTELVKTASLVGLPSVSAYFGVATFGFFRYMLHGIIEIGAYFFAGFAGSIISVAIIKKNLNEDKVLFDVLDLVLISLGLLVLAGVVEVYVTPFFFST